MFILQGLHNNKYCYVYYTHVTLVDGWLQEGQISVVRMKTRFVFLILTFRIKCPHILVKNFWAQCDYIIRRIPISSLCCELLASVRIIRNSETHFLVLLVLRVRGMSTWIDCHNCLKDKNMPSATKITDRRIYF